MSNNANVTRYAEVLSVDDTKDGDRIRVRLEPEDQGLSLEEIPYAFPLLPKMLHVKPKVNESVIVFTALANDGTSQRFYIGPIISQPNKMDKDYHYGSALAFLGGRNLPSAQVSNLPNVKGAFSNNEDITIYGRKGAELEIKENDIRLRCGLRKNAKNNSKEVEYNSLDPSFIQLRYYYDNILSNNKSSISWKGSSTNFGGTDKCNSTATIVADKINLIGNDGNPAFPKPDNKELISEEVMKKILEEAHELPYGDILVEFLKLFRDAFLNHTHPFSMIKPCEETALSNFNLDSILSDTVRIN